MRRLDASQAGSKSTATWPARPLVLHLRSRRIPETLGAAVGSTALLWAVAVALSDPSVARSMGAAAVGVTTGLAGHGLAGADVALERTAAIDWRPRRTAHIMLVVTMALGLVAATTLTEHQLGPIAETARNALGAGGLLALAATTLGTSRAWMPPGLWAMTASQLLHQLWPAAHPPLYAQVLTWPAQPGASGSAAITAAVLGVAGTTAYTILGPRP